MYTGTCYEEMNIPRSIFHASLPTFSIKVTHSSERSENDPGQIDEVTKRTTCALNGFSKDLTTDASRVIDHSHVKSTCASDGGRIHEL